ncbi:type II secretion system F family protein [Streptomyces sp. NPDC059900]|uniref:type II secretion system F family protein n=1 Tax=Streptomyces sp. NPDC059900 TaxID=3155816 RepID=UPI003424BBDD
MSSVVHKAGVVVWSAAAVLWLVSAVLAARRERAARGRSGGVLGVAGRLPVGLARRWFLRFLPWSLPWSLPWFRRRDVVRGWLAVVGAVSAGWVLVGGVLGCLVGLGAGYGMWRWQRGRGGRAAEYDGAEAARQLPLAADLLAACVAAGAGPVVAAQAVGDALKGPLGERLAQGAAELRLGGEPCDAWRGLGAIPGAGALARLLERAGDSGAPAAEPVARLAADCRAERGRAATAAARRAGVLMTAPVGLCFLPAFIAVGVLPVVIGLAGGLLSGI